MSWNVEQDKVTEIWFLPLDFLVAKVEKQVY